MPRQRGGSTQRKPRPGRTDVQRILVVTEGTATEPEYLEQLASHLRSPNTTTHVKTVPVGRDPLTVVRKCIKLKEEFSDSGKAYDHHVCLVDVDEHQTLAAACELAERESIEMYICNLKFEVWLRWHKEDKRSVLSTRQLDALMIRLELANDKRLLPKFPFEGVDQACRIARQVDPDLASRRIGPNPSSAMPLLIDLMKG
ncbi:hypothetical protein C5B85_00070 [Pseudoclavibacter sp. AY1F1]|uniref:RloB family protein n=1 Tax=Pseudoclavibacter sp. AY1F1 TaxID=2080583 RepID=UPI000CE88E89|nr:RloB family protein [Pseudoclavibacter sp. AY1F1]PPF46731.1 hypothetical protein C5B85_00070 [Pseudoclavibacter sp. AY1F1]